MQNDYRLLPAIDSAAIARDLRALGLQSGDTVLVHSAMSRIGNVQGGAPAVIAAFREVLGPTGTLMAPTFPFNSDLLSYIRQDPYFVVEETPSKVGAITEAVRALPEARRSLAPTHPFAAAGPQTDYLLRDHIHGEGPCDRHSPLYRLTQIGGYVLLLGVVFWNCTLLHTAEELARVPFIDFETRYRLRGRFRGEEYTQEIYSHGTPVQCNFPAIEPLLRERGVLTIGRVGQAECRLARAKDILETALDALRADPYALRVRPTE